MDIINLSKTNSVLNTFMAELRDVETQRDMMRFRRNVERIGEVIAYEISKQLPYHDIKVQTQLSTATVSVPREQPVVGTILRAGLPLHRGVTNVFDKAENAFVSAYRVYSDTSHFTIHTEYLASPDLDNKILILTDTMLATGRSMKVCYEALLARGVPRHIHVVCAIATDEAVNYVKAQLPPERTTLWCAAIDPDLNEHYYIVPGLGDAGDLSFGEKA